MHPLKHWLIRLREPSRPRSMRERKPVDPGNAASADDAPPKGCAWFDSSHELMRGLAVCELRAASAGPRTTVWR